MIRWYYYSAIDARCRWLFRYGHAAAAIFAMLPLFRLFSPAFARMDDGCRFRCHYLLPRHALITTAAIFTFSLAFAMTPPLFTLLRRYLFSLILPDYYFIEPEMTLYIYIIAISQRHNRWWLTHFTPLTAAIVIELPAPLASDIFHWLLHIFAIIDYWYLRRSGHFIAFITIAIAITPLPHYAETAISPPPFWYFIFLRQISCRHCQILLILMLLPPFQPPFAFVFFSLLPLCHYSPPPLRFHWLRFRLLFSLVFLFFIISFSYCFIFDYFDYYCYYAIVHFELLLITPLIHIIAITLIIFIIFIVTDTLSLLPHWCH